MKNLVHRATSPILLNVGSSNRFIKVESHNDSNLDFQTERSHHSPEGCGPYTQMTENMETDHHRKNNGQPVTFAPLYPRDHLGSSPADPQFDPLGLPFSLGHGNRTSSPLTVSSKTCSCRRGTNLPTMPVIRLET